MADGYNFNLQEYCSYCENFSPELNRTDVTTFGDRSKRFSNSISCKNAAKCERMMESLRRRNV